MSSFSYLYMTEAISVKNMEKAVKLIKIVLERNIGMKLYEFGPEMFKNKFGTFTGMKYFLGNTNRAIRFNWKMGNTSAEVFSIDVWNNDNKRKDIPTITIQTAGISLAKAIPQLADIIKNPKAGLSIPVTSSMNEAKVTVDGQEFKSGKEAGMYLASLGKTPDEIAAAIGVSTASAKYFQSQYLKTVKGVSETKIPNAETKKAVKKFEAVKYADPEIVFDDLKDIIYMVATGIKKSVVVTGMPGIGKTYTVTQHLEAMGKHKNDSDGYVTFKGTSTPFGLYKALYYHRNQIIVFDDCDSIFGDKVASNILKAALDSYDVREISWMSSNTFNPTDMSPEEIDEMVVKEQKFPNKFEFHGAVIFISNLHKSKIEPAVISRSMTIDITLEAKDVFRRMETILADIEPDVSMAIKKEVLDFMKTEYDEKVTGNQANMRTLLDGIACKRSGSPNWKRIVSLYC